MMHGVEITTSPIFKSYYDSIYMKQAIKLASDNVLEGGLPFGAVIVDS